MATVIDLLRQLGREAAPDGGNAFFGPLALPVQPKRALTLGLPRSVTTAWAAASGRATTGHHALALAAIRSGQPVVFMGYGSCPREDLLLLLMGHLSDEPASSTLWLVPDLESARASAELLRLVAPAVGLSWQAVGGQPPRSEPAQIVVATFDELHGRLLRYADRAWRQLWQRLGLIAVPDLDQAGGLWGNHLGWLLRRAERLTSRDVRLAGALSATVDAPAVLCRLLGRDIRLIDSGGRATETTLIGLWRCADRDAELLRLAHTFESRRVPVTLLGRSPRETEQLRMRRNSEGVLPVGLQPPDARIAIVSGIPTTPRLRADILHRGYRLTVMLASDEPHELLFAMEMERLLTDTPGLALTMLNPYVASCHLLAAAAELPLAPGEIQAWEMSDLVERLVDKRRLRLLSDGLLQPGETGGGHEDSLLAATVGHEPVVVRGPDGEIVERLVPAIADWRGVPGTTWAPGIVVAHRSDDLSLIDLAIDERPRYARAGLTLAISPREELASREVAIRAKSVTAIRSKVDVRQWVSGLHEYLPGRAPNRLSLPRPAERRWLALACALRLPAQPLDAVSAGWAIGASLPVISELRPDEILIFYDPASRSLWIVEAEGGGTGATEYLFGQLERLVETAYALARACESSPVYGSLARSDLAWLSVLVGEQAAPIVEGDGPLEELIDQPSARNESPEQRLEQPRRTRIYQFTEQRTRTRPVVGVEALTSEPDPVGQPSLLEMAGSWGVDEGEARVDEEAPQYEIQGVPEPIVDDRVDDVHWTPAVTMTEAESPVDNIEWEPENNPASTPEEGAPEPAAEPIDAEDSRVTPPLGRESAVPLNSPRLRSRYADGRREPARSERRASRTSAPQTRPDEPHQAPQRPVPFPSAGTSEPVPQRQEAPAAREQVVDVGAMIARMRRMREERERGQAAEDVSSAPPATDEPVPLRFKRGQRVTCVPYGEGVVEASRAVAGREQLTIAFPDHGAIDLDPAVSAVRLLDEGHRDRPDDDRELS